MVSELLHYDEVSSHTRFVIKEDNLLVSGGYFREPGLLENIAQTAATHAGAIALHNNEPVKVGYIGTVKNFVVKELPPVNEEIETTIILKNRVFDVSLVSGSVIYKGREIASCEMKIFIIK